MRFRKGQTLVELGIGVMVVVIVVGAVAIPVAQESLVTDVTATNNETFNATSDPFTYTVSDASNDDFRDLSSVTCYADTSQSSALADNDCNITDEDAGTISISTTVDAGDESINYEYEPTGYVNNAAARTVLDQIALILALSLFLAAIALVRR